jgi:hypothetical protein
MVNRAVAAVTRVGGRGVARLELRENGEYALQGREKKK